MNARIGFTVLLCLATVTLIWSALSLSTLARLLPLIALGPVLLALLLQLRIDIIERHQDARCAYPNQLMATSVIAGFGAAVGLIGLAGAISILLTISFNRMAGWSLPRSGFIGLSAFALTDFGTSLLGIFLPRGLLTG